MDVIGRSNFGNGERSDNNVRISVDRSKVSLGLGVINNEFNYRSRYEREGHVVKERGI
jgi:hypothetical protein